jgi:hypothetical protein
MTRIQWLWLILVLIYGAFFSWYTSFGGPLTDEEIAHYTALLEQNAATQGPRDQALLRRFMEQDTGDDFVMVNLIDMYDTPLAVDGVEPGESSPEVLAKYMAFMYPELFSRASHPIWVGTPAANAMDLMNAPGMERWDQLAGMRYRSRRDLLEIASNPDFRGSHDFKIAALEKTIAVPIDPWFSLGDPRLLLGLILGLAGALISWRSASSR